MHESWVGPLPGSALPETVLSLLGPMSREELVSRSWWIHTVNGLPVAVGGLVDCFGRELYLGPCVVHPDYRGKGCQSRLIAQRLEYAGDEPVYTSVESTNATSIVNLIRHGFEPCGFDHDDNFLLMKWAK